MLEIKMKNEESKCTEKKEREEKEKKKPKNV